MINDFELRKGNLVHSLTHNCIATICGLTDRNIVLLKEISTYDTFDNLRPIPIDDYWLKRFALFSGEIVYNKKADIKIWMWGSCLYIANIPRSAGITIDNVLYVHRLQNIYLDLTGEPLKFKSI